MADEELGQGSIRIVLSDDGIDADVRRLGDRIERTLDRASRDAGLRMQRNISRAIRQISPVRVRVEADLRAFGHSIDTLNNFPAISIPVDPDVDRERFEAAIEAALTGLEVSVRVVPDLDGFDAAIRAHNTPTVHVDVEADVDRGLGRSLSRITGALGGISRIAASGARLATVGIAAASAAQGVLALGAALAPAAGLLAAGPAVILGYQAALGTLKFALSGVQDAFGAALTGSAKEFDKALKDLSPKAQAAAKEVRALKPAFESLRNTVQDSFFARIEGEISATATALQGPLKSSLTSISTAWGQAARNVLQYVRSTDGVNNVDTILKATGTTLTGLAAVTDDVAAGFLQVASSVAKAFGTKTSSVITDTGNKLSAFLIRIADNGQAVQWVSDAIVVFRQLGQIASNIGGILSGVFEAAGNVGGGFLGNLKQITGAMEDFVKSAEGQEAIGNIFQTLSAVAAQLAPILGAVVSVLGQVAPALGPLFTAIGPAITGLINSLAPAIAGILPGITAVVDGLVSAFDEIASSGALTALGEAFGAILSAVAPLLPVVGRLAAVVVGALAPAFTVVAKALTPVIEAIAGALMPVLPVLAGALSTVVTALTPLAELIGTTLAQVVVALSPLLGTLATLIASIATAVAPLVIQLTDALVPVFEQLAPLVTQLVAALTPLIEALVAALLPVLPPIITAVISLFNALVPLLPPITAITAAVLGFSTTIITALAPVLQFVAGMVSWTAINVVTPILTGIVATLNGMITTLAGVIRAVSGFVSTVVAFFGRLATNVKAIVSNLLAQVVAFFLKLPNQAVSAVGGIVIGLANVFQSAKTAVVGKLTSLVSEALKLIQSLPGKAASALSGLGGTLVSAGAELINGFIRGITSKLGAVKDTLGGLTSKLTDWKGPRPLDKVILTPAGKAVIDGFIKGLEATYPDVRKSLGNLTAQLSKAVDAGKIRFSDGFLNGLKAGTAQLNALTKQREAIADRIKKANEFAASTASAALQTGTLGGIDVGKDGIKALTFGLNQATAQIRKFDTQVNALAKRGLRKDLLAQLIGLGPQEGAGLANTLSAATGQQLKDLNEAQKRLDAASKKLGRDSADNLFDAGKQASKGFLAGLKDQQKGIQDLMLTLARAMAASIRKALGIHSPSRVFRGIGNQTMDGLDLGIRDRIAAVRRTAVGAADAVQSPFSRSSGSRSTSGAAGSQAGAQGRTAVVGGTTVNQVFHLPQVNSKTLAAMVERRMVAAAGM